MSDESKKDELIGEFQNGVLALHCWIDGKNALHALEDDNFAEAVEELDSYINELQDRIYEAEALRDLVEKIEEAHNAETANDEEPEPEAAP